MLAARGLREDDELRIHRVPREFLVAVRRQGVRVLVGTLVGAVVLTGLAAVVILLRR